MFNQLALKHVFVERLCHHFTTLQWQKAFVSASDAMLLMDAFTLLAEVNVVTHDQLCRQLCHNFLLCRIIVLFEQLMHFSAAFAVFATLDPNETLTSSLSFTILLRLGHDLVD